MSIPNSECFCQCFCYCIHTHASFYTDISAAVNSFTYAEKVKRITCVVEQKIKLLQRLQAFPCWGHMDWPGWPKGAFYLWGLHLCCFVLTNLSSCYWSIFQITRMLIYLPSQYLLTYLPECRDAGTHLKWGAFLIVSYPLRIMHCQMISRCGWYQITREVLLIRCATFVH